MSTPRTNASLRVERDRTQRPDAGYVVTSSRGHRILVRRPDGRPIRTRPSGGRLAANRVAATQSYLHVPAA